MSEESKRRTELRDLPQPEKELSAEERKGVAGGRMQASTPQQLGVADEPGGKSTYPSGFGGIPDPGGVVDAE